MCEVVERVAAATARKSEKVDETERHSSTLSPSLLIHSISSLSLWRWEVALVHQKRKQKLIKLFCLSCAAIQCHHKPTTTTTTTTAATTTTTATTLSTITTVASLQ